MGRFLGITGLKGWTRVSAWTGKLKNPTKYGVGSPTDGSTSSSIRSACTSMCLHVYNWNIVACDVNKNNQSLSLSLSLLSDKTLRFFVFIFTPYNRIEHSARIRHTRDGQREGLLRIKCYIWNAVLTYIQLFEDVLKCLKISLIHWRYLQILNICWNGVPYITHLILSNPSRCPSQMWRILVECSIRLYGVIL